MIDRKEYRWILIFILAVCVITTLPYAVGYLRQTPDHQFTGLIFNISDSNSYLAKMVRGAAGDWLFRTPYTTYSQGGVVSFLPYILLGKLTALPGRYDQLIFLFQFFRIAGIILVIFAIYLFIAHFVADISLRRWGTVLSALGGGAGWLILFGVGKLWQGGLPLEFYSPETFGFLSYLGIPHLLFSRAFLLLGFLTFLFLGPERTNWRKTVLFFLPWMLIGFFQPMSLITAGAVIGVFTLLVIILKNSFPDDYKLLPRKYLLNAVWIAVVTLPFILYNIIAFRGDPVLNSWLKQNILPSPPIQEYLLGFLFVLPFSCIGLVHLWKSNRVFFIFFATWIILFPFLAYFPLPVQRRLPEGIWVALITVAVSGILSLKQKGKSISLAIMSLGVITSFVIVLGAFQSVLGSSFNSVSKSEIQAMEFLQAPKFKNKHLLASFDQSNQIPARAPVFVLIGHGPESMNLAELSPEVARFFEGKLSPEEEESFLKDNRIDLIYYGDKERKMGTWSGKDKNYLSRIFTNDDVTIYSVSFPASEP